MNGFGGIGGFLRYKYDVSILDELDENENENGEGEVDDDFI